MAVKRFKSAWFRGKYAPALEAAVKVMLGADTVFVAFENTEKPDEGTAYFSEGKVLIAVPHEFGRAFARACKMEFLAGKHERIKKKGDAIFKSETAPNLKSFLDDSHTNSIHPAALSVLSASDMEGARLYGARGLLALMNASFAEVFDELTPVLVDGGLRTCDCGYPLYADAGEVKFLAMPIKVKPEDKTKYAADMRATLANAGYDVKCVEGGDKIEPTPKREVTVEPTSADEPVHSEPETTAEVESEPETTAEVESEPEATPKERDFWEDLLDFLACRFTFELRPLLERVSESKIRSMGRMYGIEIEKYTREELVDKLINRRHQVLLPGHTGEEYGDVWMVLSSGQRLNRYYAVAFRMVASVINAECRVKCERRRAFEAVFERIENENHDMFPPTVDAIAEWVGVRGANEARLKNYEHEAANVVAAKLVEFFVNDGECPLVTIPAGLEKASPEDVLTQKVNEEVREIQSEDRSSGKQGGKPFWMLFHGPDRSHYTIESARFSKLTDAKKKAEELPEGRWYSIVKISGGGAVDRAHDVTDAVPVTCRGDEKKTKRAVKLSKEITAKALLKVVGEQYAARNWPEVVRIVQKCRDVEWYSMPDHERTEKGVPEVEGDERKVMVYYDLAKTNLINGRK